MDVWGLYFDSPSLHVLWKAIFILSGNRWNFLLSNKVTRQVVQQLLLRSREERECLVNSSENSPRDEVIVLPDALSGGNILD